MAIRPSAQSLRGAFWYRAPEGEAHLDVAKMVQRITQSQESTREALLNYWRAYEALPVLGFGPYSYAREQPGVEGLSMSLNVTRSCIDTVAAKICKNEIRPYMLPAGASWDISQRAKGLEKFLDGIRYETKAHRLAARAFRDCAVWGTGALQVYSERGRVKVDRVRRDSLRVDDSEGQEGAPRNLYRAKAIDREQFRDSIEELGDFNDKDRAIIEQAIDSQQPCKEQELVTSETTSDMIQVYEAWHLPSYEGADNGRHFVGLEQATVVDEPWVRDHFPFPMINWDEPMLGFWGTSLVRLLAPIQEEINHLLQFVQESMDHGGFDTWVERGSEVVTEQIDNTIGGIRYYTGREPIFRPRQTVSPEVFQHIQYLEQKAYNMARVSQLSANGEKPPGVDSAVAMRTMTDLESDGFSGVGRRWEDFNVELGNLMIEEGREIAKDNKKFAATYRGKKAISIVKWADVKMERDEYDLQCVPTSQMPATPAGKLAYVNDLNQLGVLDPLTIRKQLNLPDPDNDDDMALASRNRVLAMLSAIANGEEQTDVPDAFLDLADAKKISVQFYNYCQGKELSEDQLETIRQFIEKIAQIEQPLQPQAPQLPAGADAGEPPGQAGPPMPAGPQPGPGGPPPGPAPTPPPGA